MVDRRADAASPAPGLAPATTMAGAPVATAAPGARRLTRGNGAGWAFALPGFGLICAFIILPFFFAFGLSLTNARLISPNVPEYVGFENYRNLLGMGLVTLEPVRDDAGNVVRDADGVIEYPRLRTITRSDEYPQYRGMRELITWRSGENVRVLLASDVVFIRAIVNTVIFVVVVAPVQAGLALGLALLINQPLRGINVFRAIYFMPVVVSIVVVSMLWRFLYDGDDGLLNSLFAWVTFGAFEGHDWLGDPSTALGAIIVTSIWNGVGFHMVIWLAGLQTISPTLYEAARIEGASKWQTFRYVTWPGLRNTAVLILIVITMQAFALFAQIDVMTQGGPLDSTQTIVFQAVERGYGRQDISGGSTISVILFLIVLSISLAQRYVTRERT